MTKKILLIEDNPEMRENTAEILELAQYHVITAPNGKEGVELAEKELPDLIICDIMMPVLDGYGVLHLLSKKPETARIPFIFLTAKAERADLRKGMEMGADDYLTKPFDDIELLNAVETRIRKHALLQRDFSRDMEGLNEFMNEVRGLEALRQLSEERAIKAYRKKENIYTEGAYPKGVYFISKGKVKTLRTNPDGKELITGLYNAGDFVGYLALLEEAKYPDSAVALENAEICLIPKDDFFALIFRNPEVSRKFIQLLSNDLASREEQLLRLAYNSVRKRVAEALVTLYDKYSTAPGGAFSLNLSREDLANMVGTSSETAIRTLSDFKDEGLVDVKGGTVTIRDYDRLRSMKN